MARITSALLWLTLLHCRVYHLIRNIYITLFVLHYPQKMHIVRIVSAAFILVHRFFRSQYWEDEEEEEVGCVVYSLVLMGPCFITPACWL